MMILAIFHHEILLVFQRKSTGNQQWFIPIKRSDGTPDELLLGTGSLSEAYDRLSMLINGNDVDLNPNAPQKLSTFMGGFSVEGLRPAIRDQAYGSNSNRASAMYIIERIPFKVGDEDFDTSISLISHLQLGSYIENSVDVSDIRRADGSEIKEIGEIVNEVNNMFDYNKPGGERVRDFALDQVNSDITALEDSFSKNMVMRPQGSPDFPAPTNPEIGDIPPPDTIMSKTKVSNKYKAYSSTGHPLDRHIYVDPDRKHIYQKRVDSSGNVQYEKVKIHDEDGKINSEVFISEDDLFDVLGTRSYNKLSDEQIGIVFDRTGKIWPISKAKNQMDEFAVGTTKKSIFIDALYIDKLSKTKNEILDTPLKDWDELWNVWKSGSNSKRYKNFEIFEYMQFRQSLRDKSSQKIIYKGKQMTVGELASDQYYKMIRDFTKSENPFKKSMGASLITNEIISGRMGASLSERGSKTMPMRGRSIHADLVRRGPDEINEGGVTSRFNYYHVPDSKYTPTDRPLIPKNADGTIDNSAMKESIMGKYTTSGQKFHEMRVDDEDDVAKILYDIYGGVDFKTNLARFNSDFKRFWNKVDIDDWKATYFHESMDEAMEAIFDRPAFTYGGQNDLDGWLKMAFRYLDLLANGGFDEVTNTGGSPTYLAKVIFRLIGLMV